MPDDRVPAALGRREPLPVATEHTVARRHPNRLGQIASHFVLTSRSDVFQIDT